MEGQKKKHYECIKLSDPDGKVRVYTVLPSGKAYRSTVVNKERVYIRGRRSAEDPTRFVPDQETKVA